jgi:hypothetical protein
MSLMLKVGSPGNVKTKTLKAFTTEKGFKIIKNLPPHVLEMKFYLFASDLPSELVIDRN